jgi:hypothetical protein
MGMAGSVTHPAGEGRGFGTDAFAPAGAPARGLRHYNQWRRGNIGVFAPAGAPTRGSVPRDDSL